MRKIFNSDVLSAALDAIGRVADTLDEPDAETRLREALGVVRDIVNHSPAAPEGELEFIPICVDYTPEMIRNAGGRRFREGYDPGPNLVSVKPWKPPKETNGWKDVNQEGNTWETDI